MHQNPPLLVARDGWGKVRWQTQLGERVQPSVYGYYTMGYLRATVRDHLIVLWTGTRMVAVDTLGKGRGTMPAVFWPPAPDWSDWRNPLGPRRQVRARNIAMAAAVARFSPNDRRNLAANVPVMISEELLCYQRASELCGVDPMTGKDLWVRQDTRPDSILFGDDQYLFVLPSGQPAATVLRAADGKLLDTRPVPQERLSTFGRYVLLWRDTRLELWDPWEKRPVWPAIKFGPDARPTVVDRESVAVFEPGKGRFALIRIPDGRKLIDAELGPQRVFSDLHVFRSSEQSMLVINGVERTGRPAGQVWGPPGTASVPINRAHVYGFDRHGKKLWSDPVVVEDQYLVTNQPARLPVLVFACAVQLPNPNPNQPPQQKTTLLCIDKRTGRTYGPESVPGYYYLRIAGDPEQKTVEFQIQQSVRLKFSDRPPPPPPPAKDAESLWKAFLKGAGLAPPAPKPEPKQQPAPAKESKR